MEENAWIWILFVFIAYFVVLIGISVFRTRHMDDMSDYVLGGRKMGVFTSALSAGSSTVSGWTMLVFPALAFAAGLMHLWTVVALVMGAWFSWTILARRLRRYTIATDNSLTLPEFFEKRFGDKTGVLAYSGRGHQPVFHHPVYLLRFDRRGQAAGRSFRPGPLRLRP